MPDYETVSMCDDCRLVFPNRAVRAVAKDSKDRKERIISQQSTITIKCPECGKEITHLLDDCYWVRVS